MRWPFGRREPPGDPVSAGDQPAGEGPVLAVDVDGVVSLFGFDQPPPETRFELFDGNTHCISLTGGARLRRLSEHFALVWASGWEEQTVELGRLFALPDVPYLRFGGQAEFGSADWKLGPIGEYARGRALAWVDDSFDEACYEWAREREEPTLLVDTEPDVGLDDVHVDALLGWARSLGAEAAGE